MALRVDAGRIVRVDDLPDGSLEQLQAMLEREAGTVTLAPLGQ